MGKKNFKSIPKHIQRELSSIDSGLIEVGCIKNITPANVKDFTHLGITLDSGRLILPEEPVVPPIQSGRFSKYNSQGRTIVRKDLPKIVKSFDYELPVWGDYSKGINSGFYTKQVYQREYWQPEFLALKTEALDSTPDGKIVKFVFELPLSRSSATFSHDLLYRCNILQENLQDCHILASNASKEAYMNTIQLDWDIFPPGELDAEYIYNRSGRGNNKVELSEFKRRLELIRQQNPKQEIQGLGVFSKYFGAVLQNNVVVFENLFWGNALYVVYNNWEDISKIPRSDLMRMDPTTTDFERIVHGKNWESRFFKAIKGA